MKRVVSALLLSLFAFSGMVAHAVVMVDDGTEKPLSQVLKTISHGDVRSSAK